MREKLPPTECARHLRRVELLADLSSNLIEELASVAQQFSLEPGEALFDEGDRGDAVYVVIEGVVQIFVRFPLGEELVLAALRAGELLGEHYLFQSEGLGRRGASARASEPTVLLSIEGSAFLGILSREPTLSKWIRERRDQREADNLEKRSEMFRLLTSLGAVDPQASIRFDSGEIIFREGDEADAAWLITAGEDSVYKEARPDEPLARLGVGQCFGERACVSNTPRSATVRALTPIPLRADFVAQKARAAAKRSKDGSQARRLLALAAMYDGETGTEAAKIGGLTLHSRQRSQLTTAELRGDGAD